MSAKKTYITTAIPYVNAKPHLGHILEWFQADAFAQYFEMLDREVIIASGADENSLKNIQAAEKSNTEIQDWLDEYAAIFEKSFNTFGIKLDAFRRGSDQQFHWPGVQELWNRCLKNGDIYIKTYSGLYCVGCESFYTYEELTDGKCPEHLTKPEEISEENYFFKLSHYQEQIKDLIASDTVRITSAQFKNEMLGFINQGLEDFSVSRSTQRARGIGVPVPNDPTQVLYVWFDALCIYLTAVGFGYDQELFERTWPADIHVIGKGINRFHAVY
ncbi:MAG: class I tRNA ligase family protein, partial [Microgenomates group bacterium]